MPSDALKRNNVTLHGSGKDVLIFGHGFGWDQEIWSQVASAFYDKYRVVLFDHVGAGNSQHTAYDEQRYRSLYGYGHDLLEICAALKAERVRYVGHSVSGMVGVLAANMKPEQFDRLVLIGASPRYLDDKDYFGGFSQADIAELLQLMESNFVAFAHAFAPIAIKNPERPELAAALEQRLCSGDIDIAKRWARVIFLSDHRADLSKVHVPTLIMQCADDTIVPAFVAEYMHAQMARSTLRFMRATGHCPHLSQPAETIDILREYLGAKLS